MKAAKVTMKSMSPLLMHKFPLEPIEAMEKKTPEEQAELVAYRIPGNGNLCIPGEAVQRAFVAGATYSKGKGRASLQKQAAACLLVSPTYLDLGVKDYMIDSRKVRIPSTKGSVVRHRPRLDEWEITFTIEWDETLLSEVQVRRIVDDTGQRVGFLDFRPACKGPFGRSIVVHWDNKAR